MLRFFRVEAAQAAPVPTPFIVARDQLNPRGRRAHDQFVVRQMAARLAAATPSPIPPLSEVVADIRAARATKGA
jgi:hypothetical protein